MSTVTIPSLGTDLHTITIENQASNLRDVTVTLAVNDEFLVQSNTVTLASSDAELLVECLKALFHRTL